MKKQFKLAIALVCSATLILISCKKPLLLPNPIPPDEPISYALKIEINQLPGTNSNLNGLSAIISLIKGNDEIVLADKVFDLTYNGKYSTTNIPVASGNYKLVKLLIKKADGSIIYATPHAGSTKANLVASPLSITTNTLSAITAVNVEVLPVSTTDLPQDFGYVSGTFNEIISENPKTQFSFTLKSSFKIGNIVYDSIPVPLKLTTYPLKGEVTTTLHSLSAGTTALTLSNQVVKYRLTISKWGIADTVIILPTHMKDGITYILGGSKTAKKLKFESVYRQSGNSWLPDTRKEYLYASNGKLNLINHYRKAADQSNILEMKEELMYENNQVSQIKKSTNNQTSFYTYKGDGKLAQIRHTDNVGTTTGQLNYLAEAAHNYNIAAIFESTKFYYKQNYNYHIVRGNVIKYTFATTHGDSETSLYDYDFGINPYIHLQLPDLGFTLLSKHNVKNRYATYTIAIPQYDAYSYSYVYDSDGYPTELYTSYRVPGTATVAYTTKTVFNYY